MSKSVKNSSREITLYGDSCMINHELNTGYLLAGCDLFLDYIVDNDETMIVNALPFNPLVHGVLISVLPNNDC